MGNIVVTKFGGSMIGEVGAGEKTRKKMEEVCDESIKYYSKGHKTIVVVSALKNDTNHLTEMGIDLSPRAQTETLAGGELRSARLLSNYFTDVYNIKTEAYLNPFENGAGKYAPHPIILDKPIQGANIKEVKTDMFRSKFTENKILIVPGFIGRTESEDWGTLGREGSDMTAMILAKRLPGSSCNIYKDTAGLWEDDPFKNPDVKLFKEITYKDTWKLLENGSKVLHAGALEEAERNNLIITIKGIGTNTQTIVGANKTIIDMNSRFEKTR